MKSIDIQKSKRPVHYFAYINCVVWRSEEGDEKKTYNRLKNAVYSKRRKKKDQQQQQKLLLCLLDARWQGMRSHRNQINCTNKISQYFFIWQFINIDCVLLYFAVALRPKLFWCSVDRPKKSDDSDIFPAGL